MTEFDPLIARLSALPTEQIGSSLCGEARTLCAQHAMQQVFGAAAVSRLMPDQALRCHVVVVRTGAVHVEPGPGGVWHLPAGRAGLGACAGAPEGVLLPLTHKARPGARACLPFFGDARPGVTYGRGPALAGFTACTDAWLTWQTQTLPMSRLLQPAPEAPCWYALTLALEAQVGLGVMRGLTERALALVVRFLDARRLYRKAASALPQVQHSLAEVELRLRLAEVGLSKARHLEPAARCAIQERVRDLTLSAMDLLAVLLGARSFLREGPEAEFQALQQTALTSSLAFVENPCERPTAPIRVETPAWPDFDVPAEVCLRLWRDDRLDPDAPLSGLLDMQRRRLDPRPVH